MSAAKLEELQKIRDNSAGDDGSDTRLTLILDLSSKVTEQESEIQRLRDQLRRHSPPADASGSPVLHAEHTPKSSFTDPCQTLCSSTYQNSGPTDCRTAVDESSTRSQFDRRHVPFPPPSKAKAANGKQNFAHSRLTRGASEDSYYMYKNSTEHGRTAGPYRAHWASSCFEVEDLTNGDANDVCKAGISDDQDCVKADS